MFEFSLHPDDLALWSDICLYVYKGRLENRFIKINISGFFIFMSNRSCSDWTAPPVSHIFPATSEAYVISRDETFCSLFTVVHALSYQPLSHTRYTSRSLDLWPPRF
jgi:hypothetical protein